MFGVPSVNATVDYLIIGGGTAGLALATRIAEDGRYTVGVVETGGFYEQLNGNLSSISGFAAYLAGSLPNDTQPGVDWGFVTTPQHGAHNRSMHYPRGKTMGGSSAQNFLAFQRPTVGSMQKWADQVQDDTFTYNSTEPYFQKSVNLTLPGDTLQNASNHQTKIGFGNSSGPLQVSYGNFVDSWATWVRQGLLKVGFNAIDVFNHGVLLGSAWMTWTIDANTGTRS